MKGCVMKDSFSYRLVLRLVMMVSVVAALLVGCGGDDDVTVADFEGVWEATSYSVTSIDDPALSVDVVELGAGFAAEADAEGNIEGVVAVPAALGGPADLPFAATFVLEDQETLSLLFAQELPPLLTSYSGPFDLDGDTLTSTDENAVYDFGDGNMTPATAVIIMTRDS
jgi:hypothetical protein